MAVDRKLDRVDASARPRVVVGSGPGRGSGSTTRRFRDPTVALDRLITDQSLTVASVVAGAAMQDDPEERLR
jgi:hypothetical protein